MAEPAHDAPPAGGADAGAPPSPSSCGGDASGFTILLAHSEAAFGVLTLADERFLYASPNVKRVFNVEPAALIG